jgi:Ca-activated chloride channel homolog
MALMMSIGAGRTMVLAQQGLPSGNTLSIPAQQHPNAVPSIKAPPPQPDSALEVPSLKLRTQTGYEQVTVTVTDSSGKYVTNLTEDDFRILEDGQQRPIRFFRIDRGAPVSIGLVVDCSGSMDSKMWQARTAITRMVNDLDSRDDIFLESFSVEAQLVQPFTMDHAQIIDHLKFLHPLTHTALYDAVYMGLYEMGHARRDKRALVVVTDGMDNESRMTREEVIAAARAMKVLIYSIGIGDEAMNPDSGGLFSPDDEQVDMRTLKALSEETGAKAFNLHRVGDGSELSRDCEAIGNELTQQYTVAYLSPDSGRFSYRTLHVEIPRHPELSVRVRKGVAVIPPK